MYINYGIINCARLKVIQPAYIYCSRNKIEISFLRKTTKTAIVNGLTDFEAKDIIFNKRQNSVVKILV